EKQTNHLAICACICTWCSQETTGLAKRFASTLKALGNSSPGFALKPWVRVSTSFRCNSEGVATAFGFSQPCATLSELRCNLLGPLSPGLPKAQPWAEISERFQRYRAEGPNHSFVCFPLDSCQQRWLINSMEARPDKVS